MYDSDDNIIIYEYDSGITNSLSILFATQGLF